LAAVFFGFLFRDERMLNSLQDRMDDVVSQVAPEHRVVSGAGRDLQGFGRIAPGN